MINPQAKLRKTGFRDSYISNSEPQTTSLEVGENGNIEAMKSPGKIEDASITNQIRTVPAGLNNESIANLLISSIITGIKSEILQKYAYIILGDRACIEI
jgi:hypothetical protein